MRIFIANQQQDLETGSGFSPRTPCHRDIQQREHVVARVDRRAVQPHFVVKMRARGETRGPDVPDHLREMGPTLEHVTRSLMNTLPRRGVVFTAEKNNFQLIEKETRKRKLNLHQVDSSLVPIEAMSKFDHLEHRENVALALAVARHLNIADDVALAGMYSSHPDVGALRLYRVEEEGKTVRFVNALAANRIQLFVGHGGVTDSQVFSYPGKFVRCHCSNVTSDKGEPV